MKLGLQLGYWGAQPPTNHAELVAAAEEAGFDTVFTAEAWGSDAYTPLAWWGRATSRMRLGTSVVQLSARTPDRVRDGGADPRSPLRRPAHPRARRVGAAGRRGLVRPEVPQAAGPHPRVRRHHPAGVGAGGAGDQRRPALPAAADRRGHHRTGQGAQADHPSAARRHPDHAGRRGPEERRAGRRDLRRLAADLLLARASADMYNEWLDEGFARPGRPAHPRGLRDLRDRARSSSPTTAPPSWR